MVNVGIGTTQNNTPEGWTQIDVVHIDHKEGVIETLFNVRFIPKQGDVITIERGQFVVCEVEHNYLSKRVYLAVNEVAKVKAIALPDNGLRCDNILVSTEDNQKPLSINAQPFTVSVKLTDGLAYRFESLRNDGAKGDTPIQLAEYFEELAAMMRTAARYGTGQE